MKRGSTLLSLLVHGLIIGVLLIFTYWRPPVKPKSPSPTVQVTAIPSMDKPEPRQKPEPPMPEPQQPVRTPAPDPPKPKPEKTPPPQKTPPPKIVEPVKTPAPRKTPPPQKTPKPKPQNTLKPEPTPKPEPTEKPWTPPPGAVASNTMRRPNEPPKQIAQAAPNTKPAPQQKTQSAARPTDGPVSMDKSLLPDWYINSARAKIEREFNPPGYLKGNAECILRFTIMRDGTITGISVVRPSGNNARDQLAMEALRSASPLAALPQEIRQSSIVSQITFDFTD